MNSEPTSSNSQTDWQRLCAMTDADIDLSDCPEITPEMFAKAVVRRGLPAAKAKTPPFTMRNLYQQDFHAWTQEQAELLRSGTWEQLDLPNLIEEIESLGRQERQELRNRLAVLLGHLLKWQYQPANRSNSWRAMIREQRTRVQLVLDDNPSLKPYLPEAMEIAYRLGQDLAVQETGMDDATFPAVCPYSLDQILDEMFFPNSGTS